VSRHPPDRRTDEQKRMLRCAEDHAGTYWRAHRTVILCTGDWALRAAHLRIERAAGQNAYREISSVSTRRDFRPADECTVQAAGWWKRSSCTRLNGSGLAVGRCRSRVL